MKHVMNARRSIGTKTIFNLLGPLTNPLGASVQLAGVYDPERTVMLAEALAAVGTRRAFVVAGLDGMDEVTTAGPTRLSEFDSGPIRTREILPEDFGLLRAAAEGFAGGDAATNAGILLRILSGEKSPLRDSLSPMHPRLWWRRAKRRDFTTESPSRRKALIPARRFRSSRFWSSSRRSIEGNDSTAH